MKIIKFFKPKVKKYEMTGMLQFDEHGKLTICGNKAKWLDTKYIYAKNEERAFKKMRKFLENKYPQYRDMILIW